MNQLKLRQKGNCIKTNIEVVVKVANDGNRYYDHFEIKNPAGQSGKSDNQNSTQPFTGLVSLDDSTILKQSFSNVNFTDVDLVVKSSKSITALFGVVNFSLIVER